MNKQTFLEQIQSRLGEVEGEELSGEDLTAISEDVSSWAEDEIGLEDGDEDPEEEEGDSQDGTTSGQSESGESDR